MKLGRLGPAPLAEGPMAAALILATVADLALAALLVAVSGFVLQGVNNTGPMMPEAALLVGMIVLCLLAPVAAWVLRARAAGPAAVLGAACAPLALAAAALLVEPLFA
jgi:hypothetical protein